MNRALNEREYEYVAQCTHRERIQRMRERMVKNTERRFRRSRRRRGRSSTTNNTTGPRYEVRL